MHIFEALMKDHENLKDLLSELISIGENDHESRNDLISEIRDELIPHFRAEESVFYNSLRAIQADNSRIMHSFREHMEAEGYLRALQVEDKINLEWKATARKLKHALELHISEEEDEVFAMARKLFTSQEAEALGNLFEKIKPQIQDESFMKNSLEMVINLMPPRVSNALRTLKAS